MVMRRQPLGWLRENRLPGSLTAVLVALAVSVAASTAASTAAFAKISLKASRKVVEEGEQLSVVVESDVPAEFNRITRIPGLEKFEVLSESSGHRTLLRGRSYKTLSSKTYILRATQPGRHTLGPVQVKYKKASVKSRALTITVKKAVVDPSRPKRFFLKAAIVPATAYVNQQVAYVLKFYHLDNFFRPRLTPPSFEGFWREGENVQKDYIERVGEVSYKVWEIRVALFPQRLGKLNVDPTAFALEVPTGRQGGRVFDPFMAAPTRRITLKSNPVTVQVKKVPAQGLNNLFVGSLTVKGSALPKTARVGDSLNLTVTVEGTGNVRDIEAPELVVPNARVYVDKPEQSFDQDSKGRVTGTRIFRLAIVPEKSGTLRVPPIPFATLDPKTGKVVTKATKAASIAVAPGASEVAPPPADRPKTAAQPTSQVKVPVAILGKDIAPAPLAEVQPLVPLPQRYALWFYGAMGLLFAIALWFSWHLVLPGWSRQRAQQRRRRGAYKSALAQLKSRTADEPSILRSFLETKLSRSLAALSSGDIVAQLRDHVPPELLSALGEEFARSERQQYSPVAVAAGSHGLKDLLKKLDRAL